MNSNYHPIACSLHDELEALATQRRECRITFRGENENPETVSGVIIDIFARAQEEFLRLDNGRLIRLDKIFSVNEKQFSVSCDQN